MQRLGSNEVSEYPLLYLVVVVLQSCCALECCPGKGWGENRQKGLGAVSKDTVLVDSACVQAASYKLTN